MEVRPVRSPDELEAILALQARNVEAVQPVPGDGFVTVRHTRAVLEAMHRVEPSVVAMDGDRLAGYALVMTREVAGRRIGFEPVGSHVEAGETWVVVARELSRAR